MSRSSMLFMALLTTCVLCGCIDQGAEAPTSRESIDANASDDGREKVMLGCLDITRIDEMNAWKNATPDNISEAEEYAVYNDMLGRREPGMEVNRSRIRVIRHDTTPVWELYNLEKYNEMSGALPGLDLDTFTDYSEKNTISHPLKNLFNLSAMHVLANGSEIGELYESSDYERCNDVPVIIFLSRVGFNEDKTQALVDFGYAFGDDGRGEKKLLQKDDGNWTEKTSGLRYSMSVAK